MPAEAMPCRLHACVNSNFPRRRRLSRSDATRISPVGELCPMPLSKTCSRANRSRAVAMLFCFLGSDVAQNNVSFRSALSHVYSEKLFTIAVMERAVTAI